MVIDSLQENMILVVAILFRSSTKLSNQGIFWLFYKRLLREWSYQHRFLVM